jgi:hypothetical protein
MNTNSSQPKLKTTEELLQSLKEINKKVAKEIEEIKSLQEQQAYAIARIQGKMEDKVELIQQITHSLLFKRS